MRFRIPGTDLTFDIPDDCWSFAEMQDFHPEHSRSYCLPIEASSGRVDIEIVQISDIAPPRERLATAPVLTKTRIAPILLALRANRELRPVQIERTPQDGYKFRLAHGFHRYCASIAAGFTAIPGVFHEISWCRLRSVIMRSRSLF